MRGNKKGFTIIEVLVAMTLLLIGVAAVYPLMLTSMKGVQTAKTAQSELYTAKGEVETGLATVAESSTTDIEVSLKDGDGNAVGIQRAPGNYFTSDDTTVTTFKAGGDSLQIVPTQEEDKKSQRDYALYLYGDVFTDASKFKLERTDADGNVEETYTTATATFALDGTDNTKATMSVKENLVASWYKITYDNGLYARLLIYSSEFQCKLMAVGDGGKYAVMDPLKGSQWTAGTISVGDGIVSSYEDLNDVTFSLSQQKFYIAADNGWMITVDKFDKARATQMKEYSSTVNSQLVYPDITCVTVDDSGNTVYAGANYEHNTYDDGVPDAVRSQGNVGESSSQRLALVSTGVKYPYEVLFYDSSQGTDGSWTQTGQWAQVYNIAYGENVVAMSGRTQTSYSSNASAMANGPYSFSNKSEWGTIIYRNKDGNFIRRIDESSRLYDGVDPFWGLNPVASLCFMPNFKAAADYGSSEIVTGGFIITGGAHSVYNCVTGSAASNESLGNITGHSAGDTDQPQGVACKTVGDTDTTITIGKNGYVCMYNGSTGWNRVNAAYTYVDTTNGNSVTRSTPSALGGRFAGTTINALTYFEGKFYAVGTNGFIACSADGITWSVIDTRDKDGNPIDTNFNSVYGYNAIS